MRKDIKERMILAAVGVRCEKCDAVGIKVHHIIHLLPKNVIEQKLVLNKRTWKI